MQYITDVSDKALNRIKLVAVADRNFVALRRESQYAFNKLHDSSGKYLFKTYSSNTQPHPQRVINSHIRYIDNFRRLFLLESRFIKILLGDNAQELLRNFSKDVLDIIQAYIDELKRYTTDDDYISSTLNATPGAREYYIGGQSRADMSISGENKQYHADGKAFYSKFQQTLNAAKKAPLDWKKEVHIPRSR